MARSIAEIKDSMTANFMRNSDVARAYGFETGAAFSSHFSKVSVEGLLFYVVACATWALENLFDRHAKDVEERIEAIMPHRPKWYRDKVLCFMKDKTLVSDTDYYDTTGMSEGEIEAAHVVKYAAATENADVSVLTIKVAGDVAGERRPLDSATAGQLAAYIAEIKDAGVRVNLVNQAPDAFNCEVDIYYDAMLLMENVESACREAITRYIENLPFNGEYTNMALVDCLQVVDGVRVVELRGSETMVGGALMPTPINARYTPASGYFKAGNVKLNMVSYQ